MKHASLFAMAIVAAGAAGVAHAELRAGVGAASINPMEAGLKTQLGGYGERLGEPAHGTHDTIWAKALLLDDGTNKAAIVSVDTCTIPSNIVVDSLAAAGVEGYTIENTLMPASHSHGGTEGFSLDPRNVFGNPRVGVYDQAVVDFTVARIAEAIKQAAAGMQPVTVGSGTVMLPGFAQNRRDDEFTDDELVALRVDRADGTPLALVVNFAAHGTFMTEKEMLVSGDWAGNMQRTVEDAMPGGVTCLYMNGAEGDIRPGGGVGGSRYEQAEDYGRRVGLAAAQLAGEVNTTDLDAVKLGITKVTMPPRVPSPDFLEIAGVEYGVTEEMLGAMLQPMFASEVRLYALRLGDWQAVSFPGEAICQIGLKIKAAMREAGVKHPCISGLTSEQIGYILTKEEYEQSGYEATASFYGPDLGELLTEAALKVGRDVAGSK
jgi:hypothetical protein